MIPKDFASAHEEVFKLCDRLAENHSKYHEAGCNETALRKDFLESQNQAGGSAQRRRARVLCE